MSLDDFVSGLPADVRVHLLLPARAARQVQDQAVLCRQEITVQFEGTVCVGWFEYCLVTSFVMT